MKKIRIRLKFVNGLNQNPVEKDFTITPCLKFAHNSTDLGSACGVCVEWGYWAYGIALYKIK